MSKDVLEVPEKMSEQFMYNEMLKQVVAQKKSEFEALQGKITQYKTQLSVLEESLRRTKVDFDADIAQKKTKLNAEESIKRQDWTRREEALSRNEAEYVRRLISLESKEGQAEKIREERNQLMNERLRYESLNREAQERMNSATVIHGEANNKLASIISREKEIEDKFNKIRNEYSSLESSRNELAEVKNYIETQKKNLEELRKEITPKVDEYNKLVSNNSQLLKELKEKELSIAEKFDADNRLFDTLQTKDDNIKKRTIQLNTWEEDLKRREMAVKK